MAPKDKRESVPLDNPADYNPLGKDGKPVFGPDELQAAQEQRSFWATQIENLDYSTGGSGGGGSTMSGTGLPLTGLDVLALGAQQPDGFLDPNSIPAPGYADTTAGQLMPNGVSTEALASLPAGESALATRQADAAEKYNNPTQYLEENAPELLQEQGLMEKGLSFLGGLFNYEDDSDLQIFGLNLSAVESTWDFAWQYITGARNVLDTGITALISAAPGGVRTYEWDEITGGVGFWEVLSGEIGLKENVGPSPMQTAIASVAVEAKRIREGDTRLSDALLFMNPATAPFLLAGLAAESSPLQQDGFDLLDPEMRAEGFSEGWEKWMSGIGDAGVQIASPSIGATAAAGILMKGALGVSKGGRVTAMQAKKGAEVAFGDLMEKRAPAGVTPQDYATSIQNFAQPVARRYAKRTERAPIAERYNVPQSPEVADAFWRELDDLGLMKAKTVDAAKQAYKDGRDLQDQVLLRRDQGMGTDTVSAAERSALSDLRNVDAAFDVWQERSIRKAATAAGDDADVLLNPVRFVGSSDDLGITNPLARFMNDVLETDTSGKKVRSAAELAKRPELRNNRESMRVASLLHAIDDPFTLTLAIQAMHGVNDARRVLAQVAPAISDDLTQMWMTIARNKHMYDPNRLMPIQKMLEDTANSLTRQRDVLADRIAKGEASDNGRLRTLQASLDQVDEIRRFIDGEDIDRLSPTSAFFDPKWADDVANDLYRRLDIAEELLDGVYSMSAQRTPLIMKDNWFARQVGKRRERNARARYEYSMEGALPIRRVYDSTDASTGLGRGNKRWEIGWKQSEFKTNPFRRVMRGWMWLGTETPSGYIALKGPGAVGNERELDAVLDLDMYQSEIKVTYRLRTADGVKIVEDTVGGPQRRIEIMNMWGNAKRDPSIDPKSVLTRIEKMIEDDMAKAYGFVDDTGNPHSQFKTQMIAADRNRAMVTKNLEERGTWVDPKTGDVNNVPYLKHQMANGHFMHNYHYLEHKLQKLALSREGGAAGAAQRTFNAAGTLVEFGGDFNNLFQEIWRPAVLLRMAYPQRNVFEGISRAVAFYGSLAPIAWPVVATGKGIANVVRKRIVASPRRTKQFLDKVGDMADFQDARIALNGVADEYFRVNAAYKQVVTVEDYQRMLDADQIVDRAAPFPPEDQAVRLIARDVPTVDGMMVKYEWVSEAQWKSMRDIAEKSFLSAEEAVRKFSDQLDEAAGNGRFGKWRRANIKAAREEYKAACGVNAGISVAAAAGLLGTAVADQKSRASREAAVAFDRLNTLKYDPTGAVRMFREAAGRQTRIGSGQSLGPDGGMWDDGFADEFALYNYNAASSDISRKTSLAANGDVWGNAWRQMDIQENVAIKFDINNPREWNDALAANIERVVDNPLVRAMLTEKGVDPEAGLKWLFDTEEGLQFALTMRFLQGTDFEAGDLTRIVPLETGSTKPGMAGPRAKAFATTKKYAGDDPQNAGTAPLSEFVTVEDRLAKMMEELRNPLTGKYMYEQLVDEMETYVSMVANDLNDGFQNYQFLNMLTQRARAFESGSSMPVTGNDVSAVTAMLSPDELMNLNAIIGSTTIDLGRKKVTELAKTAVAKMFKVIGTIPEDALVRGPFYNKRFKQVRNDLIIDYWMQVDPSQLKGVKRGAFSKSGAYDPDGLTHGSMQMPIDEVNRIMRTAHMQALGDTKEYLYTIERRTNLGKYGEAIWPFISAQQNTYTAIGKILYKNPWIAPAGMRAYRSIEKLAYENEDGEIVMPMPLEWVDDRLKDALNIPIIGGVLQPGNLLMMDPNTFNVWAPDTGFFGQIPRFGGLVPIAASTLFQIGVLSIEPPDILKRVMGDDAAEQAWQYAKDYMFGEEFTYSIDDPVMQALPPWLRKWMQSKDPQSRQYANMYMAIWADETRRANSGERDTWPDVNEINVKTTNTLLFEAWTLMGLPSPLNPYPTVGKVSVARPVTEELQRVLVQFQQAEGVVDANGNVLVEPGMARVKFAELFGTEALEVAMTGTTENMGGAAYTRGTVNDIKTYTPLIEEIVSEGIVNEDLRLLDILINNSNGPAIEYDNEAAAYLALETVPATSDLWRRQMTGNEAVVNNKIGAGWTEYRRFKDDLDARMASAGVKSLSSKAGIPFKDMKTAFLQNMASSNPEWLQDYIDGGTKNIVRAMWLMDKMVKSPLVQQNMMNNGQEQLYANMASYVATRQRTAQALATVTNEFEKASILEWWDAYRHDLAASDVRWADIATRWLDADDRPGETYLPLVTMGVQ